MFLTSSYNGRFLMTNHDPTAAPMSAKIIIGIRTAAVEFPPALNGCPRNFSQCFPLNSDGQSHNKSPLSSSLQKAPFWHGQTRGRGLNVF